VSQSSSNQVNGRVVLIQRANELSEFADLLSDLAVPIDSTDHPCPTPEELVGAALAIIPGSRLIESGSPNLSLWPRTVAVVDDSSRTLVAHLNRLGVAMVIRRPIHPRTLRLLLLHEIYQGPERRNRKRISIGHPIRTRSGLFKQRATLLELSPSGARVELPNAPKIGSKIAILVGKDLTQAKPLKIQAKVIRCIRASGTSGRSEAEIGVTLVNPAKDAKAIAAILDRFAAGPASWNGAALPPDDSQPNLAKVIDPGDTDLIVEATNSDGDQSESLRSLPPIFATPGPQSTPPDSTPTVDEPTPEILADASKPAPSEVLETIESSSAVPDEETAVASGSDRRTQPRIPYDRRMVVLGEEAARVLIGRDLSQGGMRIATTDAVAVGDVLRVALHCGTKIEPVVVLATALRNDGDEGTCLVFQDLSSAQCDQLEKIIASSSSIRAVPDVDSPHPSSEEGGSLVLGEMIETVERGAETPKAADSEDGDDEIDRHLDSIFDTDEAV
jgi:hypothetical protein